LAWLALGTLSWPPAARAQTVRYVDDDSGCEGQRPCYQSIQAAVDAAAGGDTISVAAGRYTETVVVVDEALLLEGPGIGDPAAPSRADQHALWVGRSGGQPGAALVVDALTRDVAGVKVSGFRIISSAIGIHLLGRRSGDPVPPPSGRPASTTDTTIAGARVADNLFEGALGGGPAAGPAVVATWGRDLTIERNRIRGGGAGVALVGGTRLRVHDNTIDSVEGVGVGVRAHGGDIDVSRNTIQTPGGRGVEVRALVVAGLVGRTTGLKLADNTVVDAAAEGIDVAAEHGGLIEQVELLGNRVIGAGGGLGAAGVAAGSPLGAIALRGAGGGLAMVRVQGGNVEGMHRPAGASGAGIYAERVTTTLEIVDATVAGGAGAGVELIDIDSAWIHRSTISGNAEGVRIVETAATAPGAPSDVKLGGFAGEGNNLAGNTGDALALVNARGTGGMRDVDASYNAWGTAYAPDIEARIRHRPDDGRLGLAGYLPALGTPRNVELVASPPQLVADGASESIVTATVADAIGRPAADGTLVLFTTEGGTLARPGLRAEAEEEDGPGAVRRTGEWGMYESAAFGPFSGSGYLRSDQAGETLSWAFDAPALLLRYGQTVLGGGTFVVQVDGRDVGAVSTLGPRKTWVERVVAADLGPGSHTVVLTVQSGEVNVDLLAGGAATAGGRAEARLRSGPDVGAARVTATAHGADGNPSAMLVVPFTAGPPALVAVAVGASTLAVGGERTTVTAEVRDARGRTVPDRTEVRFTATLGSISPDRVLTQGGRALATFASGNQVGQAGVRAEAGGIAASQVITLTAGPPASVTITPDSATLPANSTSTAGLTIAVHDAYGHPVRDGTPVLVTTNLGFLEQVSLTTVNGIGWTRLRAGPVAGEAFVRASAGAATGQATVVFEAPDIRIIKRAEPQTVVVPGERVTFTLRVDNVGGGIVYDLDVKDPLPAGLISQTVQPAFIPPGPEVEVRHGAPPYELKVDYLQPGQTGLITITARVDTSLRWGPHNELVNRATAGTPKADDLTPEDNASSANLVIVPGSVVTVTVRGPERLTVGGATGKVTARVTDRFGNPVANGTSVFFTADLGTVNPAVAQTRNGVAETTLTSSPRAGLATVRAISTGDRGGLVYVRFTAGPPTGLAVAASKPRLVVGGDTAVITATLADQFGNGAPDELVRFDSSLGLLSTTAARTGPLGTVTTTLRSNVLTGVATVRAISGPFTQLLEIPFDPGPVTQIDLTLDQSTIPIGARVRAVAETTDEFGNPVPGIPVEFSADVGVLRQRLVVTDDQGRAVNHVTALRTGNGLIRATGAGFNATAPLVIDRARVYLPAAMRGARLPGRAAR